MKSKSQHILTLNPCSDARSQFHNKQRSFLMKNSFKKALTAILIAVCGVWALDDVSYIDENGELQIANGVTAIRGGVGGRTLTDGWYILQGTFSNYGTITISGTVHLIIEDGSEVWVVGRSETIMSVSRAGISVSAGNSLSIYAQSTNSSMGKLTAIGKDGGSGIGGDGDGNGGTITINGGEVTATGDGSSGAIAGSTINISGGTVTATGGGYSGAIAGSTITITGGEGTAKGSNGSNSSARSAGIAGNTITITGGEVTATGSNGGAGIGVGNGRTINISGGTVTAKGSDSGSGSTNGTGGGGAGIGGRGSIDGGSGGTVNISGGTVMATGSSGIGGGYIIISSAGGGSFGNGGTVTITGGTVTATGYSLCNGIGGCSTGTSGTFTLNGNAVVFANSIGGYTSESRTKGILFIGNNGTFYGENVTLEENVTIPSGRMLTIPATFTIPADITLTNNGTITPANNSKVIIAGTVDGNNKIIGANAPTPTLASRTTTSITIYGANLLATTGQSVEYAKNTINAVPASGWQTETTFAGLVEKTTYWIFARSKENIHFAKGTETAGLQVATKATPAATNFNIPTGHIYTGNSQGFNISISGMGTVTVYYNGSTVKPTNAGIYAVTIDVAEGTEFAVASGIALGEYKIAAKPLTITSVTATNRAYNGTTIVELAGGVLNGVLSSDVVGFTLGTGTVVSAEPSSNKAVTTNITLNGTGASNYTLTQPTNIKVTISEATQSSSSTIWSSSSSSNSSSSSSSIHSSSSTIWSSITVAMRDDYGDGWNGAALGISVNGTNISPNATISSGSSGTYTFNANPGDVVAFYWVKGNYDNECAFAVYYTDNPPSPAFNPASGASNDNTRILLSKQYGSLSSYSTGASLGSFTVPANSSSSSNSIYSSSSTIWSSSSIILSSSSSSSSVNGSSSSNNEIASSSSSDYGTPISPSPEITFSNLPPNTKIKVYNLQGKLVYSAYPENPSILKIGVQTKGMYIVKIGTQIKRVVVR
jgi:hypothetical protein